MIKINCTSRLQSVRAGRLDGTWMKSVLLPLADCIPVRVSGGSTWLRTFIRKDNGLACGITHLEKKVRCMQGYSLKPSRHGRQWQVAARWTALRFRTWAKV